MEHSQVRCDAVFFHTGNHIAIHIDRFLIHASPAFRHDTRPAHGEAVMFDPQLRHQAEIFFVVMHMIAGLLRITAVCRTLLFGIGIPDAFTAAVFRIRSFHLISTRCRAPDKVLRKTALFLIVSCRDHRYQIKTHFILPLFFCNHPRGYVFLRLIDLPPQILRGPQNPYAHLMLFGIRCFVLQTCKCCSGRLIRCRTFTAHALSGHYPAMPHDRSDRQTVSPVLIKIAVQENRLRFIFIHDHFRDQRRASYRSAILDRQFCAAKSECHLITGFVSCPAATEAVGIILFFQQVFFKSF